MLLQGNQFKTSLSRLILIALLSAFALKPAVRLCCQLLDINYEFSELLGEEEDAEEKEIDDVEEDDKLIETSIQNLSMMENQKASTENRLSLNFIEFYPGVQLPPPEFDFA